VKDILSLSGFEGSNPFPGIFNMITINDIQEDFEYAYNLVCKRFPELPFPLPNLRSGQEYQKIYGSKLGAAGFTSRPSPDDDMCIFVGDKALNGDPDLRAYILIHEMGHAVGLLYRYANNGGQISEGGPNLSWPFDEGSAEYVSLSSVNATSRPEFQDGCNKRREELVTFLGDLLDGTTDLPKFFTNINKRGMEQGYGFVPFATEVVDSRDGRVQYVVEAIRRFPEILNGEPITYAIGFGFFSSVCETLDLKTVLSDSYPTLEEFLNPELYLQCKNP
jgi:hypothetical protein